MAFSGHRGGIFISKPMVLLELAALVHVVRARGNEHRRNDLHANHHHRRTAPRALSVFQAGKMAEKRAQAKSRCFTRVTRSSEPCGTRGQRQ